MTGRMGMEKKMGRGFVVALVLAGLLLGCEGRYQMEKMAWKPDQDFEKLQRLSETEPEMIDPDFVQGIIDGYRKVLERYPSTGQAAKYHLRIGLMLLQLDKRDEALREFETVVRQFAGDATWAATAQFYIGKVHEDQGDWEAAEAAYTELLERYPWTTRALEIPLYIARHYAAEGDHKAARAAYDDAIKHYDEMAQQAIERGNAPAAVYCQNLKAEALSERRKYREAIEVLENIVDTFPASATGGTALLTIGRIYQDALRDPEKAAEAYRRFLEGYTEEGAPREAIKELRGRRQEAAFRLGQAHVEIGEYDKAIEAFKRASEVTSKEKADNIACRVQIAIAQVYERQGEWDKAMEILQKAEQEYPRTRESLQIPLLIAMHYANSPDEVERAKKDEYFDKAIEKYRKLLQTERDKRVHPIFLDMIAAAQRAAGRWDDYINTLLELKEKYPDYRTSLTADYQVAYTYDVLMDPAVGAEAGLAAQAASAETPEQRRARLGKAIEYYQAYIQHPTRDVPAVQAQMRIAQLYFQMEDYDKAVEVLQKVIDDNPNRTGLIIDCKRNIAAALARKPGGWEEALKLYNELLQQYPDEPGTLQVKMAIADHWAPENADDPEKFQAALDDAVAYYERVAARNPDTELAASALFYTAGVWIRRGEWDKAREAFERLINDFPDSVQVSSAMTALGVLYRDEDKLNDKQKAVYWFERVLKEYPDSRGIRVIQAELERLRSAAPAGGGAGGQAG